MLERLRSRTPSGLARSPDRRPGPAASQTLPCSGSSLQKAPLPGRGPRSPAPQPHPRRALGRVALLALGCPSELVRNARLSSVTRCGDSFSHGHGPESIRSHLLLAWPLSLRLWHGSVAQWHLVDLLGKPGGTPGSPWPVPGGQAPRSGRRPCFSRAPGASPARVGTWVSRALGVCPQVGSFHRPRLSSCTRSAQLSPGAEEGQDGSLGRLCRWTVLLCTWPRPGPPRGEGLWVGCSRHQPDLQAPVSSGP